MFSRQLTNFLQQPTASWNFCFEIESKGQIIRLTDYVDDINYQNIEYKQASSLNLVDATFEDSGYGEIVLKGCFEENGITENLDLQGAKISIFIYAAELGLLEKWLEYYCSEVVNNVSSFEMVLTPLIKRCEASVVEFYSTTCRASLGDQRCGLTPEQTAGKACDKTFRMCCNEFNNAVNFRGEPFIPTIGYFKTNEK